MRRFVPRAIMGAALVVSAAACAAGTATSGGSTGGDAGGRFQVMIPDPAVQGSVAPRDAERVAGRVRSLVSDMTTHTAVDLGIIRSAMEQYGVTSLDSTQARQLAQQLNAQNVLWLSIGQGGAGLTADAQFIDVASGDAVRLNDVSAPDANELANAIFSEIQTSIGGLRQASLCNEQVAGSQYDLALATCDSALAVVPTSTAALYGKATALLQLERHEDALGAYEQLLELDSDHQDGLLGAGLAASELDRSDEASGYYDRYLQLNPGNPQVRMTVASRIANTGDFVSAYKVLEPTISAPENVNNPEFQRYLFGLATAAGTQVATDESEDAARPYYETALQAYGRAFASDSIQPDVSQIRQAIAVNVGLGNTEEALSIAREATVQYDTVASVWYQYGSALVEAGQHAEAVQVFTRVAELDPDFENVYIRRGMAYLEAGQRQQALADLQRAAQAGNQADVARVLFAEANKMNTEGRFAEAESLFEQSAQYADAELKPQATFFQGYMLFRQGDAIARANSTGALAEARQALDFFQRAKPLLESGTNPQKAQIVAGVDQYIAHQQAVIQAAGR